MSALSPVLMGISAVSFKLYGVLRYGNYKEVRIIGISGK